MQAGIVGMGIMGRLLALALHNAGWQVTLFDCSDGNTNCSSAAAGLLTPFSELDKADRLISRLGQKSIKTYWPRILKQVSDSVYFKKFGTVVLTHPNDQAEWYSFNRRISDQLDDAISCYQPLSQDNLMQLEPELAKFETAYYFPDEAHIDCQSLLLALHTYLDAKGVKYVTNTHVVLLKPHMIVTDHKSYEFDMVFDCRGLGASQVFSDLRAVRGELIWLHAPDVALQRPIRLLHPRYSLYLVPRPGNIYLVGATEIEAKDCSPISVRSTLELLTAVYYVHAGFAEARILKTVTHCRPTLSNHLPRIKFTDGLIAVNGLYRHGYLIAPVLAEEIVLCLKTNQHQAHYPEIWET